MPKTPRLREWRARAALSQEELRDLSGVSRATIADLEAGNRGAQPRTIRKLADALGVEPEDLYGVPEAPKAEAPPSPEQPPLNGFLEEGRRASYYRPWTNLFNQIADRWEAEIKHYHQMPLLEVAGRKTKQPFDSGRASEISAAALDHTLALQEVLSDFGDVVRLVTSLEVEREVRAAVAELLDAYERLDRAAGKIGKLSRPTPEASFAEMQQRQRDEQRVREARQHIRLVREETA